MANKIKSFKITSRGPQEINFKDHSSLDAITRQLPNGFYSTFRTYGHATRVIGLKAHLRRIYEPVRAFEVDAASLRRQLAALLEPFRADEARVRVIMTDNRQLYVVIEPLQKLPQEVYRHGVRAETAEIERDAPRLKSTAFISQSVAQRKHIAYEGIFEALLVKNGRILEGMTSNFFYMLRAERSIKDAQSKRPQREALYTSQRDILLGVTRRTVIHVARGRGVDVRYIPLKLDQLSEVKEAFITSSSRGIVPVVQIDDVKVGEGMVGEITKQLSAAYKAYVLEKAERI
jgi:branched-chain amino acid aminotransferase